MTSGGKDQASEGEAPGYTEDEEPTQAPILTTRSFTEDLNPTGVGVDDVVRAMAAEREDKTRQVLAYGIVAVLALFYLVILIAVICRAISVDDMVRIVGAMSGIQTLAAAVAGFYFAHGKKS